MSGQEREESKGFYEMLWDCDHCSAKGLLGKSQRHCPECGGPQNADKRYFPTDEQKKAIPGHTYEGADAYCPACKSPMGAKVKNCTQCGSPMDGSKVVKGADDPKPVAAPPKKGFPIWIAGVIVGVLVVIFLIWFLFFRKKEMEVTVTKHHWEAVIEIEEFGDIHKSAWRNEVPSQASNVSCHREQRSSHKVQDGEECHMEKHDKKDGTFEEVQKCSPKYRDEPDYDDKCDFTVRDWKKIRDLTNAGTGTAVAYPTSGLTATTAATYGAQREGHRYAKVYMEFNQGDACDWKIDPHGGGDEATWKKYEDGKKYKVNVRARSEDVVCGDL